MIQTKALVLQTKDIDFSLEDIWLEELQDDEVLVDMVASGICHTDLNVQHGNLPVGGYPIVVGHEGSGIVRDVGASVSHVRPGDKVLLSSACCEKCRACKEHHTSYCTTYHTLNFGAARADGSCTASNEKGPVHARFFGQSSFAKTSVAHRTSVIPVKGLTIEQLRQLAPLGCGLMTGSGTVFNMLGAKKGESITIFGAGGVGFGAIFAAKSTGLNPIIVVEVNEGRLALAKELGATHTINPKEEKDVVVKIKSLTDDWGVDYSVETTANEHAQLQAVLCVHKLGKMAVIGSGGDKFIKVPTETLIITGVQILGVAMGDSYTPEFIPKLVEEYRAGRFPLEKLTKFYQPEDVNQATHDMHSGKVIKPILLWQ